MTASSKPRVLVVSLRNWLGATRLPKAFSDAGFDVATLSFPDLLMGRCRRANAHFLVPDHGSEDDLILATRRALAEAHPALVVPTDEAAVELLQAVAATATRELPAGDPFLGMLRDSLGDFSKHATLRDRRALANLAAELGVRAPAHTVVRGPVDAAAFVDRQGLPVVFKAEESFAGLGVSICRERSEVDALLSRLAGARALKSGILAQTFVPGRTAMRAVAAWRGQVVGGLSAIKVETHPGSTGPSSVVEFIENDEMASSTRRMIGALGLSGFASLDFILEENGAAHLIELNPRPTPICHLGQRLGNDLCVALRQALAGEMTPDRPLAKVPQKVALFPQEWVRNANSPHFNDAFHDVPWDEPELMEAFVLLGRAQMRGGQWRVQEERREKMRDLLTRLDVPAT